jgi:hypothetical protein
MGSGKGHVTHRDQHPVGSVLAKQKAMHTIGNAVGIGSRAPTFGRMSQQNRRRGRLLLDREWGAVQGQAVKGPSWMEAVVGGAGRVREIDKAGSRRPGR